MNDYSPNNPSPLSSPVAEVGDPLSKRRVQPPVSQEAWDSFLNRYTIGEYHKTNYSFGGTVPSIDNVVSAHNVESRPGLAVERPSPLSISTSSRTTPSSETTPSDPLSPTDEESPRSPAFVPADRPQPPSNLRHSSNQDPNIPNIPDDRLVPEDDEETNPFLAGQRQQLTRQNMGQLNRELEHSQNADADGEGEGIGEPSRRRKKGRRRTIRPSQVELVDLAEHSGSSASDEEDDAEDTMVKPSRRASIASHGKRSPHAPKIRLPRESYIPGLGGNPLDSTVFDIETNSTSSRSQTEHTPIAFDHVAERARIREFYDEHGYMPAPHQPPDAMRRRLRAIRRLGLDQPTEQHRKVLSRFTRLAVSIFKCTGSQVSVIQRDKQSIVAEIGLGVKETSLEVAFCAHTILGQGKCFAIPDASEDWRFRNNPLAAQNGGKITFYAGAPLRVGTGPRAAVIGSMCIFDSVHKRVLDDAEQELLEDLADCAISELELLYTQQASIESAKLHQVSVDFLRRSLKSRPHETAGSSRKKKGSTATTTSSSAKRKEGADRHQSEDEIDIYDEACLEIRLALSAYAVAVVDLSQFHLFYPSYQNSSMAGTSSRGGDSSNDPKSYRGQTSNLSFGSDPLKKRSRTQTPNYTHASSSRTSGADQESFGRNSDPKQAANTYTTSDPLAPAKTPQVLFIPAKTSVMAGIVPTNDTLAMLGYSCAHDGFAFNFASTPAARKIISEFIATNVRTRRVWYARDDSEGIAQSINHLMPDGTETSLAMPIFDFDGQVSFAIVACWKDPLYTYPAGALQFVETIAGSLLASVLKERLYQAERAQLNFASAASHELRTPLHQINAAASLLRGSLHGALSSDIAAQMGDIKLASSPSFSRRLSVGMTFEDRIEALAQLEIIEANGLALGHILENIIDTLDIATPTNKPGNQAAELGALAQGELPTRTWHLGDVLEDLVNDAAELESKTRRIAGGEGLGNVEIILEVLPRHRGRWLMATDPGPLKRALSKIIHNSCKFTDKGYIHITVQDTSREVSLPAGYDNSIRMSTVSIDIKDSGRGMTADFLDKEFLRPFSKADPFMPGSGLGVSLAQRTIEILGGTLAINSKIGRGTLVHIEVPIHLLSNDNEADQEELEENSQGSRPIRTSTLIRTNGIYLAGFDSSDPGVRRVGRSLVRQLTLHFCRVVENINFASLIVVPAGSLTDEQVAELAKNARPNLEIIYLHKSFSISPHTSLLPTPSVSKSEANEYLATIPTTHLFRPLRPSILRQIFKAPAPSEHVPETYVSDVVGGEPMNPRASHESADEDILPSPRRGRSPTMPPWERHGEAQPDSPTWTSPESSPIALPEPTVPTVPSTEFSENTESTKVPSETTEPGRERKGIVSALRPELQETASDPLPAVESLGERPAMKEMRSELKIPDDSAGQLKVLVVEDNAVNRKILTTMLKRTACKFAEAVDGAEAVAVFLSFSPDLVLLDINMPVKDGFQAAAEMRGIEASQKRNKSRIIAVTALSSEAHKRKGMVDCGISEWRTKPVAIKELREEVERMKIA